MTSFYKRPSLAFALAEIAIALGIASIALVSLMGLLGVFFNVSKSSSDDTLLASMSARLVDEMRAQPFSQLQGQAGQWRFFDAGGNELPGELGAQYQCMVTPIANTDPALDVSLFRFRLTFQWPVGGTTPSEYVFHSSIADYE